MITSSLAASCHGPLFKIHFTFSALRSVECKKQPRAKLPLMMPFVIDLCSTLDGLDWNGMRFNSTKNKIKIRKIQELSGKFRNDQEKNQCEMFNLAMRPQDDLTNFAIESKLFV